MLPEEECQTDFFRKMSVKNLEQCGTLAEQLISLRTDLDRSNLNVMRMQRQRCNSLNPTYESVLSPKPEEPPKPMKMDQTTASHSRKESFGTDTRLNQSHQEINRSSIINKRKDISNTQSKNTLANRMMPPRAPLVAKYNSNSKNMSFNIT
jgi:hypothetical protein